MSDLKLYVYDMGWSGADLIWAKDEAEAKDYVAAKWLPMYEERVAEHEKYHGVNGLKEFRKNPWVKYVDQYKNRDLYVEHVPVTPGIAHSTDGE